MKKYLLSFLVILFYLSAVNLNAFAVNDDVTVTMDGSPIIFDQLPVIINGRTLVPIRAVCEKIGATVAWDGSTETATVTKDDITLSLKIGSQIMQISDGTTIFLDVPPQIYGGRTLLPIRAVVEKLGCEVQWNERDKIVRIQQVGIVMVNGLANTQEIAARNWASISPVQQFAYKNEGLAYGYIKDKNLEITMPNKRLSLEMKYPILGDVLSDDNGDIYIVWGRNNDTDNAKVENVFISKYSSDGQHIKTTGFVGTSSPWGDDDSAKTKYPFLAGNCVSVIADGVLVNYHAKQRYDGHQSDNVIAVKTSDMSVHKLPNDTFSGHSFNQSIIYSRMASEFIFASHGDAYARGFRINDINGRYGNDNEIVFHFYLEPNANYNMYIVNKTFAQLGNIVETSKGIALVGASVKSISEEAKQENQNLFIQIFNPLVKDVSSSMFIGGTIRSGATSTDINDNNNSPLKKVTDYGIHWLTDYTDTDVITPQVVEANDSLVILWATKDDTFYMVLSAEGDVLTPATILNGLSLNSFERPIYYNDAIYWVAVKDGRLKINVISLEE